MTEKSKITVGQKFLNILDSVCKDKDKLLDLANGIIENSHSRRGLLSRNLPDDATAVMMRASVARFNAQAGKDVSSDNMLILIADTYRREKFGSPEKFKADFEKKYPVAYNAAILPHKKSMLQQMIKNRAAYANS